MNTSALHLRPTAPARRISRLTATPLAASLRKRMPRGSDAMPGVDRLATPSDIAIRSVTPHVPHR